MASTTVKQTEDRFAWHWQCGTHRCRSPLPSHSIEAKIDVLPSLARLRPSIDALPPVSSRPPYSSSHYLEVCSQKSIGQFWIQSSGTNLIHITVRPFHSDSCLHFSFRNLIFASTRFRKNAAISESERNGSKKIPLLSLFGLAVLKRHIFHTHMLKNERNHQCYAIEQTGLLKLYGHK